MSINIFIHINVNLELFVNKIYIVKRFINIYSVKFAVSQTEVLLSLYDAIQ